MPKGVVHNNYWKQFLIIAILISIIVCLVDIISGISFLIGYLLGRFITPDLDLANVTEPEWKLMQTFGCFGAAIVGYWLPYGHLLKHRSFLSHFPMVSTAIRIVYGFWWVVIMLDYVGLLRNNLLLISQIALGIWAGLSVADTIHWTLDNIRKH